MKEVKKAQEQGCKGVIKLKTISLFFFHLHSFFSFNPFSFCFFQLSFLLINFPLSWMFFLLLPLHYFSTLLLSFGNEQIDSHANRFYWIQLTRAFFLISHWIFSTSNILLIILVDFNIIQIWILSYFSSISYDSKLFRRNFRTILNLSNSYDCFFSQFSYFLRASTQLIVTIIMYILMMY